MSVILPRHLVKDPDLIEGKIGGKGQPQTE